MLVLGLLLIVVAAVVFGYMFFATKDLEPMDIDLGVFTVELTPLHLYLLGAATLALLALGLMALAAGMRASRRRHQEVKELRKAVRDEGPDDRRRSRDREPVPAPVDGPRVDQPRTDRSLAHEPSPYEREASHGGADQHRVVPSDSQPARSDDPEIALPSDYQRDHPDGSPPRR